MVSLGDVVVRFLADTSSLSAGVEESSGLLSGIGGIAAGVGIAAGAALIGIGAQSVHMAADFQQSMLKVQAYAGLSTDQMKSMQSSIMSLSGQVAQSPKALADAIYPIISSGYAAKDALNILSLSAKTAAASGAQTSVVADMLTTSLGAMHAPASQATQYMDQFNKIVALGKGEVPQYAAVIGKLSLAADAAHVPFGAMGAALADLTTHGFPSVAQASTALGNLFTQMGPKVDAMKQHADKLGIAFNENAFKTMDLSQKLDYLQKVTGGNQGELLKLVGGNTLALKAFDALSNSSKTLSENMKAMGHAAGTTDDAFKTASQGFNFQMQKLKAAGDVLMVTLGNALLPTITRLVAGITPLVTKLTDWETQTHGIEKALTLVGSVVGTIVTKTSELINTISSVVSFFQKNQVAADLLAGALAGVAVAILAANAGAIIAAVTAFPAVVIGFGAWAIAAGAAAIATLAAAAPFIAIGILVALVVAGIILAVQHWGDITKWLSGVWAAFSSWFMGALGAVGKFFGEVWNGIASFFVGVWNGIINTVKGAVAAVVGWFVWLYNHNYYFKDLVDFIRNLMTAVGTWLSDTWKNITTWITLQWDRLSFLAQVYWELLAAKIRGVVTAVGTWLANTWSAMSKPVVDAWNKISGIIGGAWNTYIAGPLGRLGAAISGWFGNLANAALQWGKNLIQGLINGIGSMLNGVGKAAANVAATVGKFLGFHSPTELGPGRDADKWAPNLVKMYAGGIAAGVPALASASSALVAPLGPRLNTAPSGGGGGRGSQTAHIHVYLGGKEIVSQLMPMVYDEARAMTGWRPVG